LLSTLLGYGYLVYLGGNVVDDDDDDDDDGDTKTVLAITK